MSDEPLCQHRWHDVTDTSEQPERVASLIGRWPGVKLMEIGKAPACGRCGVRLQIESACGETAQRCR